MLHSACWILLILQSSSPTTEALRLWQKGQDALLDNKEIQAIDCFEESLVLDPGLTKNYLSLAAVYLGRGENELACRYLTLYMAANPRHIQVREHYADLLHRMNRLLEAQHHYEQFIADIQDDDELAQRHLIPAHSQLMQIAEKQRQSYQEHLHRGIGLFLLATRYANQKEWKGEESQEALLCRAAGELRQARIYRPYEARPCWYLYEVWSTLLQSLPAKRHLRLAHERSLQTSLTPMEHRSLRLAWEQAHSLFAK